MAEVDLGKVVGEKGATGERGPAGATGERGPAGATGEKGITPTFKIKADGHLYADYDNPYKPKV